MSCTWDEFLTGCNNAMAMYLVRSFCWKPSNVCMILSLYPMASESPGCYKPCGFSKASLPTAFELRHILDYYYGIIGNNTRFRRKSRRICSTRALWIICFKMKIISWNVQGMKNQALQEILFLKRMHKPNIMFILETMVSSTNIRWILPKTRFEQVVASKGWIILRNCIPFVKLQFNSILIWMTVHNDSDFQMHLL